MEILTQLNEYDVAETYGTLVARNVTFDGWMEHFAAHFTEFDDGKVIALSPAHLDHDRITAYIRVLLETYLALRPVGRVVGAPFVMKLEEKGREPDLQVILNESLDRLQPTFMDGAADIVIEVVSPESVGRDHGQKYDEYEQGSVPEYWILDPIHNETRFYRREGEAFVSVKLDDGDIYTTPRLPGFKFLVPLLWQQRPPNAIEIVEAVKAMLGEENSE